MSAVAAGTVPDNNAKRLARLAAVQGLYQIALTGRLAKDIIRDFASSHTDVLLEDDRADETKQVDHELFSAIVTGVMQNAEQLDEMLSGSMDARFSIARLEVLLRAILRAGAYELHHHGATASSIIINDYVDVTHAFFNDKEPGLVNAVLDKLAKNLR
jgi:N utilization substance protein B